MTDTRDSFDKLISDLRLASGAAQSIKRSGTAMLYDSFADRLTALQSGAGDAQDAARYKVFRSSSMSMREFDNLFFETINDDCNPPYRAMKHGKDLDDAADNAIATQGHDMGVV